MKQIVSPTAFVIFGATGDLTQEKLFPALFALFKGGYLTTTRIFAVARKEQSKEEYFSQVKETLLKRKKKIQATELSEFFTLVEYIVGDVTHDQAHETLESCIRGFATEHTGVGEVQRVYYLALPPDLTADVVARLSGCDETVGVCRSQHGSVRVVLEKPFGIDYTSAKALKKRVQTLFTMDQVFLLDHYLGKESVQNLFAMRFANPFFEAVWHRGAIEHIEIVADESSTVVDRGAYYDTAGAIKDMVQSHLIQLIATLLMEKPKNFSQQALSRCRNAVISSLRYRSGSMVRGQYAGYLREHGVERGSRTETYVYATISAKRGRLKHVPIIIRTGKGLAKKQTRITVRFKPNNALYHDAEPCSLTIELDPCAQMQVTMNMEKEDFAYSVNQQTLSYEHLASCPIARVGDYERLLLAVMQGKEDLFLSFDEVLNAWRVVEPLLRERQHDTLFKYQIGSNGPRI